MFPGVCNGNSLGLPFIICSCVCSQGWVGRLVLSLCGQMVTGSCLAFGHRVTLVIWSFLALSVLYFVMAAIRVLPRGV